MEYYNDKKNQAAAKILFMFAQMIVLVMVYIIIYTSFVAVQFAIKEYALSSVMYFPVAVALVVFPILLYKYRQMFNAGRMLTAFTWMMGTASLIIVLLYVYVAQITG